MRIDAHQHFWRLARGDYSWLTAELAPIYRDHEPRDLTPLLKAARIDRTVLVQAAPTDAETDYLLRLAETTDFVAGVAAYALVQRSDAQTQTRHARGGQLAGEAQANLQTNPQLSVRLALRAASLAPACLPIRLNSPGLCSAKCWCASSKAALPRAASWKPRLICSTNLPAMLFEG